MTDIDLTRETSDLLTEVRTVLSRAETALKNGQYDLYTGRRLDWAEALFWIVEPKPVYSGPNWEFLGYSDGVSVPHPDREEMRLALEEVVRLLSPWKRKKGKKK